MLVSSVLFVGLECVNSQFNFQWTYTPEQGVAVGAICRDAAAVVKNGLVYLVYSSEINLYYAGSADASSSIDSILLLYSHLVWVAWLDNCPTLIKH